MYEHNADVGAAPTATFRVSRNWTVGDDIIDKLHRLGIDLSFEHRALLRKA